MILPSSCHTTDRDWTPEREPLGATLHRIGVPQPCFDRMSFIRVMYSHVHHKGESRSHLLKVHWGAAQCLAVINSHNDPSIEGRTLTKNEFGSYPEAARCMFCNEKYLKTK